MIATTSPKRLARFAGLLYLLIGIFGAFAQGIVYPKTYVAGDAATTAANLVANSGLVRLGVVADFLDNVIWVFLALVLYQLLKHVSKAAARAMVVLVTIGAAITLLNTVFEFEGLRVATGAVNLASFGFRVRFTDIHNRHATSRFLIGGPVEHVNALKFTLGLSLAKNMPEVTV